MTAAGSPAAAEDRNVEVNQGLTNRTPQLLPGHPRQLNLPGDVGKIPPMTAYRALASFRRQCAVARRNSVG